VNPVFVAELNLNQKKMDHQLNLPEDGEDKDVIFLTEL
jgi:hypothetical protein